LAPFLCHPFFILFHSPSFPLILHFKILILNFSPALTPLSPSLLSSLTPCCLPNPTKVKPLLSEAPYGKGTETVIDKEVRNALELAAESLRITNTTEWEGQLNKAVSQAAQRLVPSLPPSLISSRLYKLVVYEEGGFFKPHRDTQRSEEHFATLVILLPGKASGGDLVLRHGSFSDTFSVPSGKKRCSFVAFFTDVEHEVTPVTKGRRVSLLYHLFRKGGGEPIKAPEPTSLSSAAEDAPLVVKKTLKLARVILGEEKWGKKDGDEPPAKKQKLEGKGKEKEEEEEEAQEDFGDDAPAFIGFICSHSYAGELAPDKLKGPDTIFYQLFAPHFPGTRIAQIEVRVFGTCFSDSGSDIRKPSDLDEPDVEVDELDPKKLLERNDTFFGGRSASKVDFQARPLYSSYEKIDHVQFLNDKRDLVSSLLRIKHSERSVAGTGNEGSSGSFLYKKAAILVPLAHDSEDLLEEFSSKHALRGYPDLLP